MLTPNPSDNIDYIKSKQEQKHFNRIKPQLAEQRKEKDRLSFVK